MATIGRHMFRRPMSSCGQGVGRCPHPLLIRAWTSLIFEGVRQPALTVYSDPLRFFFSFLQGYFSKASHGVVSST